MKLGITTLAFTLIALALGAGGAQAGLIFSQGQGVTVSAVGGPDAARAAEAAFKAGLGSSAGQSFESIAQGNYESLSTNVGTFEAVTKGRLGHYFSVASGNISGRVLEGQFLESRDLVAMSWDVDLGGASFDAIGFYIQDPADTGAVFRLTFADGSSQPGYIDFSQLQNKALYFVSVFFDAPVTSALIDFANINRANGDGWGIDNLTVGLVQIPEPATLTLLGLGLAGVGLARSRRG